MPGKKRRKGHARQGRRAVTANKAPRAQQTSPVRQPDWDASTPRALSGIGAERAALLPAHHKPVEPGEARAGVPLPRTPRLGRLGSFPTALMPGRVFFAMERPVPGLICYAMQVTLLGWLPAALWAIHAERRVAKKQRELAARLRPR
jgi:hypothetical protein